MCEVCGCSDGAKATLVNLKTGTRSTIANHEHPHPHSDAHSHDHGHAHDHDHDHDHGHGHGHMQEHDHDSTVALGQAVLKKNNERAERNRVWLAGREILAINLLSSPGAGKTTLLERTIRDHAGKREFFVIEGDQATANDGDRITAAGAAAVQVNTGTGCHLEADMVARGLKELAPPSGATVIIENIGNLVCPALFDLGEQSKVVIISVTEGEDKPLKYPHMFQASDLVLVNKIDLLPHLQFDLEQCLDNIRKVNPRAPILQLSATSGKGMNPWYEWIEQQAAAARERSFA